MEGEEFQYHQETADERTWIGSISWFQVHRDKFTCLRLVSFLQDKPSSASSSLNGHLPKGVADSEGGGLSSRGFGQESVDPSQPPPQAGLSLPVL